MKITENERAISTAERQYLLYRFLLENSNKDNVVSAKRINDFLDTYDIVVSSNTLYNDLDAISRITKIEVKYDFSKKGYYLKNPPFQPHELRLMVDSIQASPFITQQKADEITRKISSLTDRFTAQQLRRQSFVEDRIRSMNESIVKDADRIFSAIREGKKIAFKFFHYDRKKKKVYSRSGKVYIVSPFAMIWRNGYYYLYAFVDGENRFRYFRIDRMDNISKPLLDKRSGEELYSAKMLTKKTAKSFGIRESKEASVSMRFNNGLVDAVMDAFGKDVMMMPDGEDHFTITERVRLNMDFYAWLFSLGRGVKIIRPQKVVDKMCEYTQNITDMYKDDGEM